MITIMDFQSFDFSEKCISMQVAPFWFSVCWLCSDWVVLVCVILWHGIYSAITFRSMNAHKNLVTLVFVSKVLSGRPKLKHRYKGRNSSFFLNNLMSYHTTQTVACVCIQVHECLIIYVGIFKREWQADDDSGWQLKASRQNRFIFNSTFPFIKFCSVVAEQAFFACCLSDWITLCIYSLHERDVPFVMPCRHKKAKQNPQVTLLSCCWYSPITCPNIIL